MYESIHNTSQFDCKSIGSLFPMTEIIRKVLLSIFLAILVTGCDNSQTQDGKSVDMNNPNPITDKTRQALLKIQDSRIFFGHQSVGANILTGLQSISKKNGIELNIKKVGTENIFKQNVFAHSKIGKNKEPKYKIDDFSRQLIELDEIIPDVAFMKFCYIDFTSNTNVEEVFNYYHEMIKKLKKERPNTVFIHLTVPLTSKSYSIKSIVKQLIGRPSWNDDAANVKRGEFNNLLIKTFSNEYIFDIARIESTRLDGSRESFVKNNKTFYRMVPDYTTDGGHLNSLGQQLVAIEMVDFLSEVLAKESK